MPIFLLDGKRLSLSFEIKFGNHKNNFIKWNWIKNNAGVNVIFCKMYRQRKEKTTEIFSRYFKTAFIWLFVTSNQIRVAVDFCETIILNRFWKRVHFIPRYNRHCSYNYAETDWLCNSLVCRNGRRGVHLNVSKVKKKKAETLSTIAVLSEI